MKEKDREWKIACMDALESIGRKQFLDNIEILENYRMVNNELLYNHYVFTEAVTDLAQMATKEFDLPPYLRHYDMIGKVVRMLSGEYQNRPDIFRVCATDEFSTNEYLRHKGDLLIKMVSQQIQQEVQRKLQEEGIDINRTQFSSQEEQQQYQQQVQQETEKLTPEALETYMTEKYQAVPEKWGELVLKLDKQRFNTPELEMMEFEDMLICDRAYRHFYLKANGLGYMQERWNPIRVFWHKSPDIKYVEEGDYVGRVYYLSINEIIGRYGHKMRKEDLENLYGDYLRKKKFGGAEYSFFQATNVPFENYPEYARTVQAFGFDPHTGIPYTGALGNITNQDVDVLFNSSSTSYNLAGLTLCTEAYWRSQKKVGFLIMQDPETGQIVEELVDETFIVPDFVTEVDDDPTYEDFVYYPERKINTVRWTWVNETWGGVKVNIATQDKDTEAVYIDVKPLPFQFKGDIDPYGCKLPVCGAIFNNTNAKSMSLVSMMKPYQILYNVFMNKLFQLASTDMGKLLVLDPRSIPNDKDWGGDRNLQKWVTASRDSRIAQVDTSPQARVGSQGQPPITIVDGSVFDQIKMACEIANMIEQQALLQVGVTMQRLGQADGQTTATGVMQNLKSSYSQTESFFTKFSNYKLRVLQMNLDIAQYCSATNRDLTLSLVEDDMQRQFMAINGTDLLNSQLGVRVFSSQEMVRQTEMLRELIVKNNTTNTPLSALAEVIYTNSPARIIEVVKRAEATMQKQIEAKNQHEMDMLNQKAQIDKQTRDEQNQHDDAQKDLDRQKDIEIATIRAEGGAVLQTGPEGVDILATQGKLALDRTKVENDRIAQQLAATSKLVESTRKHELEKKKLATQKELADKQLRAKEKEIAAKKILESKKAAAEKRRSDNDLKIAKVEHAHDIKSKNKDMELKDKELRHKKALHELDKKSAEHDLELQKKLNQEKLDAAKKLNRIKIAKAKKPPKK